MTTFYVNNAVSTSGNGTSWSSAWKNLSNINWSAVQAGDTIEVSGGTYREGLTVGKSGVAGKPITIMASDDAGHNSAVIIDGQNARSNGVTLYGRNHVEVDGFDIRNHTNAGVSVKNATAGVVIENNKVFSGNPGDTNARGYDVRNSVGENAVIVRKNSYSTVSDTLAQTDGIWSSANNGVVFEGNRIVISNNNTNGHSDGFQSYQDHNVTFRNNYIEQANSAATDNHGMWISDTRSGGTIKVHNNVVLAPNLTRDSAVTHWHSEGWGEKGSIQFWGNTVQGGRRTLNLDNTPNADVKNNILMPADGGHAVMIQNGSIPAANFKGNLVWAPKGYVVWNNGSTQSMADWQKAGYNAGGLAADPKFVNLAGKDVHLTSASPAIDKGVLLSSLTTDNAGTARPQGNGHDIGAFEYKTAAPAPAPAPSPTTSATKIVVNAHGAPAGGVNAKFNLLVDGVKVGEGTAGTTAKDYVFSANVAADKAHQVQVQYTNDGVVNGQDRNLFVNKVTINAKAVAPTDSIVTYDRGALDGKDVIAGQSSMWWGGTLVVKAPSTYFPATTVAAKAAALDAHEFLAANATAPEAPAAHAEAFVDTVATTHSMDAYIDPALALHHDMAA